MSRRIFFLLVLLLLQLALGYSLSRQLWDMSAGDAPPPLFDISARLVDDIHITDDQGNEAILQKQGKIWTLPELENLPADSERIERVLEAITRGETGWPVANSIPARQRFQVAGYHFRRRIIMAGGHTLLGTVYLGTSPGFRKVHARNDIGDDIYALRLNAFDLPAESEAWLDRRLLQVRAPLSILSDGYSLKRKGDAWLADGGSTPDQREIDAMLEALRSIEIQSLAEEDMQRDLAQSQPEMILEIDGLTGTRRLELFRLDGGHYIYSSEFSLFFRLSQFEYQRLSSLDARLLEATMAEPL